MTLCPRTNIRPLLLPSCTPQSGWTPLHHAARSSRTRLLEVLAAHGADTAACTPEGWTPLMLALAAAGGSVTTSAVNLSSALAMVGASPDAASVLLAGSRRCLAQRAWSDSWDVSGTECCGNCLRFGLIPCFHGA